jgi:alginate O-acetyltransferase complex protein AlgI
VNPVFAAPAAYSPLTVASAVVAYSLQIYCDFSGYSDIAIGISRIIGFDLPENFNMPYLATSITDFWRRWHITLSSWLRDYLYIPLGGNRRGRARTYLNLSITMVLGGLWHGASWTFVFWGLLHGLGLAAHRLWKEQRPGERRPLHGVGGWLLTYVFVCTAWVFFRAADFGTALLILRKVTGFAPGGVQFAYLPLFQLAPFVVLGHVVGIVIARQERTKGIGDRAIPVPACAKSLYARSGSRFAVRPHPAAGAYALLPIPGFAGAFGLTVWAVGLLLFATIDTNPFIYFQF